LFPDTPSNVDSPVGPGNSRNHNKKGQNVLFIDGSVRFEITNRCGLSPTIPDLSKPELPDNIFTAQAGSSCNKVPAQNLTDSVIQEP
ncbi:MAG: hypothetical protein ACREJC_23245, partial [Tepidisphaeraceae bacterium]